MIQSIYCPNCGEEASEFAFACPNCGFPIVFYVSMEGKCETQSEDPLELVARNPHTPSVILEMLCENDNPYVRAALAQNPSAAETLMFRLADDEDVDVRIALASSPSLTVGLMEKLTDDEYYDVLDALRQNIATPEYIQRELEQQMVDDADGFDGDEDSDDDYDDHYDSSSYRTTTDDFGNEYYRYGDMYLPYQDGRVEYDGKHYDVHEYDGDTWFFDEDNGWVSDLP